MPWGESANALAGSTLPSADLPGTYAQGCKNVNIVCTSCSFGTVRRARCAIFGFCRTRRLHLVLHPLPSVTTFVESSSLRLCTENAPLRSGEYVRFGTTLRVTPRHSSLIARVGCSLRPVPTNLLKNYKPPSSDC